MLKAWIPALLIGVIALTHPALAQTPGVQKPPSSTKPPQPKIEKAVWTEQLDTSVGLSQVEFAAMGLSKLTPEQFNLLMGWSLRTRFQAEEKGKQEGKDIASSTILTFSCGPRLDNEAAVSKVSLFVQSQEETLAAMISGIREKLRSISDVRIVYDLREADLDVSMIGAENKLVSNQVVGYSASVLVSAPCQGKLGTDQWNFERYDGHFMNSSGRDVKVIVDDIVSTLDAKSIEDVRKSHAFARKYLPAEKKP